ncbi:MAG: lysophospholipase [Saccharofermentans sp.]|nr:lysophospholipase [Saccharofermentans sp.]
MPDKTAIIIAVLVLLIVLIGLGAVYIAFLSFCDAEFKRIFARPKPQPQVDRSPKKIDRSTIYGRGRNWFYTYRREWLNMRAKTFDGTVLSAYYRPSSDRDCRNMVILLHDYDEHPSQMAAYAKLLMKKVQCHCLILHSRAHQMSGGKYYSYGLAESVDLDTWFAFTRSRLGNDCRIYIMARGTGATAALLAAQQKTFCPNVVGIITDSPMLSLNARIKAEYALKGKNAVPVIYRLKKLALKTYGFDMDMTDCGINAGRIRVPVLIFEGAEDKIALPSDVRTIYDNLRCKKRMIVVDNADHNMAYESAQAMYEKEIQKFIESCILRLVKHGRL